MYRVLATVLCFIIAGCDVTAREHADVDSVTREHGQDVCRRLPRFSPAHYTTEVRPNLSVLIFETDIISIWKWPARENGDMVSGVADIESGDFEALTAALTEAGLTPTMPVFINVDKDSRSIGVTMLLLALYKANNDCYSFSVSD